jgi:hypothetical protein
MQRSVLHTALRERIAAERDPQQKATLQQHVANQEAALEQVKGPE